MPREPLDQSPCQPDRRAPNVGIVGCEGSQVGVERGWCVGIGHHGFVETTPNGVAVRGLRVMRSSEYRRVSIWATLLGAVLGEPTRYEENWSVLTVHDGPHTQSPAAASPVRVRRTRPETASSRWSPT